jgi:hypothetical protein
MAAMKTAQEFRKVEQALQPVGEVGLRQVASPQGNGRLASRKPGV